MSNPRIFLSVSAALLSLASALFADTVILKNGEQVEGKILRESDTEVVIDTSKSASISDERVINRSEIKDVKKIPGDVLAWPGLKGLALGEESLQPAEYQSAITRLRQFLTSFPKSAHAAEATATVTAFEAEKMRVDAGELKLEGKWLTKEEVAVEGLQIKGKQRLRQMKRELSTGQIPEALNTFAVLEKEAGASASFPEAVVLARQALASLKPVAEQYRTAHKARAEENKRRVENATGPERLQLESIHKREAQRDEAAVAEYERLGNKWPRLAPATDKSLGALAQKIGTETAMLNRYNVEKMNESLALAAKAKAALAEENYAAAEESYRKAASAWTTNDLVKRLQPLMVEGKVKATAKIAADKKAEKEAKEAEAKKPKIVTTGTAAGSSDAAAPVEDEAKPAKSMLSNPVFWLSLVVILSLAAAAMKYLRKDKPPEVKFVDR